MLLDKDATLSGEWDGSFTTQSGTSTVDGEGARRGINANGGVTAIVERFTMQNGSGWPSGGIDNLGTLTLNSSTVSDNTGGGIDNDGTLTLNSSTVSDNTASGNEGGISNSGTVTLQNTILAGNMVSGTSPDCYGVIDSSGYNLIGDTSGCTFSAGTDDLLNVDARLFALIGSPGYHPLLRGSPAIDAGNPVGCTDHLGNPLGTDQRGVPRVGRCDIGSYEFDPANNPLTDVFLPIILRNY